jgi:hypothetical protein
MKTIIAIFIVLLISISSFGQQGINYKAVIKDNLDNVVANQSIDIQFIIYEGVALTNNVYQESHTLNTDSNGIIITNIGEGTTSDVFTDIDWGSDDHFLNVQINTGAGLTDMGTTQFMAVPYALNALSSSDNYWSKNGTNVYTLNSNVGIGTNNPTAQFSVNTAGDTGIYGNSSSSTGTAIEAYSSSNTGNTRGVDVTVNSPDGIGVYSVGPKYAVYGFSSAANSTGIGLRGRATGSNSKGVEGVSTGSSGTGVYGDGEIGIYGNSSSSTGYAIEAYQSSNTGSTYGIWSTTNSPDGTGIVGIGPKTGVYGFASAANAAGIGVRGRGTGATALGVKGEATGTSGKAIYGEATGIYGKGLHVKVTSTHSSANAILAESGGGASYAGYFVGNVHVAGVLSKSSGSFKIDHPLDPENKYLSHSFVESPDMMNIYNGNIITDKDGHASVMLPDYFEALNMEFRYQLTVIGEFAQAIISEKIEANTFKIKTDKPNVEVSWQVTGVRNDAFARKNRIQVEEKKETENIGTYLNPEAF